MKIDNQLAETLIEMLMTQGYANMSAETKDMLVLHLAEANNLLLTDITTDFIFQKEKQLKIEELSSICQDKILKGFVSTNGHTYRANRDDQINMIGQKDMLDSDPSIEYVQWKTEDVGYISHTKEEWLKEVYFLGLEFKKEQLLRYNYLKTLVENAVGEEELLNISWDMPNGEPSLDGVQE